MVASARSPCPVTATTVPNPNVSWDTRSPTSKFIVLLTFPVGFGGANDRLIDVLIAAVVATLVAIGAIKVAQLVHQDPPTCAITAVAAKEGDTLWGIAREYCPDHSRTGETVTKIIAMNNGIVNIHAGQVINLPFKKGEK